MCGMSWRLKKRRSALTVIARSTSGSHTTTTTSATSIACCASYKSSTEPGQSRIVHGSPRKVALATLISVDIWRARASAAWSPTELPSRTLPRRLVVPLANNMASSNVVLPDRYGPTSATQRGALGIEILHYNPGLAALRRGHPFYITGSWRAAPEEAIGIWDRLTLLLPAPVCHPGASRDPFVNQLPGWTIGPGLPHGSRWYGASGEAKAQSSLQT